MKKPSGAQNRKLRKQKDELDSSFNLLGETPNFLKNTGAEINNDLSKFSSFRESGYNTQKISAHNAVKKQKTAEKIVQIRAKYLASNYPNKKAMYLDIAEKENIKPRTAMKYMTMK
jgi:hypothetical protein